MSTSNLLVGSGEGKIMDFNITNDVVAALKTVLMMKACTNEWMDGWKGRFQGKNYEVHTAS
jgi:hypothetical protein